MQAALEPSEGRRRQWQATLKVVSLARNLTCVNCIRPTVVNETIIAFTTLIYRQGQP